MRFEGPLYEGDSILRPGPAFSQDTPSGFKKTLDAAEMAQRLGRREHLFDLGQQPAAGGGQHHPGRGAFEQHHAQLVLECLDLRAEGGLADVQALGGPGDVTDFRNDRKASQLIELHA